MINLGLNPRSLTATNGISIDFYSSRYLDVSILWIKKKSFIILIYQGNLGLTASINT